MLLEVRQVDKVANITILIIILIIIINIIIIIIITIIIIIISFVLLEVREVDEVAGTSTIKFSFKREWEDQRLLFHSERELSPEEKDKIWLPWTIFSNLRDRKAWVDTDKLDLYKVKLRNDYNPEEVIRNRSHHMVIEYEREKIIEFMCDYDMFWYPFDSQSCGVEFYQRDEKIILFPKSIAYKGPRELEQYTVEGVFLCSVALQVGLKDHFLDSSSNSRTSTWVLKLCSNCPAR